MLWCLLCLVGWVGIRGALFESVFEVDSGRRKFGEEKLLLLIAANFIRGEVIVCFLETRKAYLLERVQALIVSSYEAGGYIICILHH